MPLKIINVKIKKKRILKPSISFFKSIVRIEGILLREKSRDARG
jgi:hypothetical protein